MNVSRECIQNLHRFLIQNGPDYLSHSTVTFGGDNETSENIAGASMEDETSENIAGVFMEDVWDFSDGDDHSDFSDAEDDLTALLDSNLCVPTSECNTSSVEVRAADLISELYTFITLFGISRRAADYLLKLLKKYGLDVPQSFNGLKSKCNTDNFKLDSIKNYSFDNDRFFYFGISENFKFLVDQNYISNDTEVTLHFNMDGLPLFNSSRASIWPILMMVKSKECSYENPLPVGLFYGTGKPPVTLSTSPLIEELTLLSQTSFTYTTVSIRINSVAFICDAQARIHFQCITSYSGYGGCGYCRHPGEYHGFITYPKDGVYEDRSDELSASGGESNQKETSPLLQIPQLKGLVTAFPPEYMHLVLLGVVRRLCKYFFTDQTVRLHCRLSNTQKEDITEKIHSLSKCLPDCFSRRLRGLHELANYKSVEYRIFLLYFSPLLLKNHLAPRFYDHFLLHFSIYCLCSYESDEVLSVAEACIEKFLQDAHELYGPTFYSYNVHVLSHLVKYVRVYGKLDNFSAFPYENYLRLLKSRLRCSSQVDKQIINIMGTLRTLYHSQQSRGRSITSEFPNNCAMCSDGSVLLVTSCSTERQVSGIKMQLARDLYAEPYNSSHLKIGYYHKSSVIVHNATIEKQCIVIPQGKQYIIIPIAHEI